MSDKYHVNFNNEFLARLQDLNKRIEFVAMDEFHIYAQPLHPMWDVSWQFCAAPYPQWDGSRCWSITAILQWTATSLLSPHVLAATVSAIFLHLSTSIFAPQHVAPSSHPSTPTAPLSLQPGFSIPQRKDNDGKSTEDDDHMTIHDDDLKAMFTEFNSEIEQSRPSQTDECLPWKAFEQKLDGEWSRCHLGGLSHAVIEVMGLGEEVKKNN